MAEIRLSGINKVYPGGTHAVHDVDLHIADGEFMIMVGPSGCAKSTILRMIAGLETPTSGTLEIGGRLVNDVPPKDRDIAMVFQSYALYPHMTVRENMAFGLRLRRMPQGEIDQRVAEAARILGLEQLLDRLPKAMSGGQRQRVAMGRAIVREPQAFLMDEPLSNLDAKLRVQMRTEIAKLHQRLETTTVYVTHDQVEAMTLGQRICILRKGVVQQVDTPFQVYQNPANVFVGGFIGSPGMNFMNGHLKLHDGVLYLQLGDQHLPVPASVTSRLVATTDLHGRGVIVGIRPEHLAMSTPGDAGAIAVNVELTEAMGAEVYAYFTANVTSPDLTALSDTQATAANYIARLGSGADVRVAEQIMLRPDMDELHLFDAQSLLTLLAPANEAEVRARQSGAAIQLATGTAASMGSPVAAPASTLVQPVQPVIHLHQTIVQPEHQPAAYGTLPEHGASPAAIASVFDQPVASPIHVEPLVVGAPAVASAGQAPGAAFAARPMVTQPTASAAPAAPAVGPGLYANLGATGGSGPVDTSIPSPMQHVSPLADELVADATGMPEVEVVDAAAAAEVAEAVEAAQPAAPVRRGFAPRVIGATPAGIPLEQAMPASSTAASDDAATIRLDDADLDAALDAIESVDEHRASPIEGATHEAVPVVGDTTLDDPVTVPFPRASEGEAAPAPAVSGFRAALERIRTEHAPVAAPRLTGSGVLPPPMSLAPAQVESLADTMGAPAQPAAPGVAADTATPALPQEPVVVRPPQLPGITPPNQG